MQTHFTRYSISCIFSKLYITYCVQFCTYIARYVLCPMFRHRELYISWTASPGSSTYCILPDPLNSPEHGQCETPPKTLSIYSPWIDASGNSHRILQDDRGEQGDALIITLFSIALHPALLHMQDNMPPNVSLLADLDDVYYL